MGENTAISWASHSWNPWIGCEAVSPGCDHCYAKTLEERWGRDFSKLRRTSAATWAMPARWQRQAVKTGEPVHVFTCSMSDFFHNDADAWRPAAWAIIRATPNLTYQILTKRHGRIAKCLPADWGEGYANVWLGVSVENQEWADHRIPVLLSIPAKVRFLSCEPLLGPVDLRRFFRNCPSCGWPRADRYGSEEGEPCDWCHYCRTYPEVRNTGIHWVIVGGESGPGFRLMDLNWARSLRDQCAAAGVSYWGKQDSGRLSEMPLPTDLQVRQFPAVQS